MVKALIIVIMSAMLAGCASPYHSMRDSGYSYPATRTYVLSPSYFDAAWYPWWSMDYFYLGSHYYRPFDSSFSFGLYSGYPYYSPYFFPGYYSAWYAPYRYYDPWFGGNYGWGFGYSHYHPYWRHHYAAPEDRTPRRDPANARVPRQGKYWDDGQLGYSGQGSPEKPRAARNVSVAPSGNAGDRGMVIINRSDSKIGPTRAGPVSGAGMAPSQAAVPRSRIPAADVRVNPAPVAVPSRRSYPSPMKQSTRRYSDPGTKSGKSGNR
jgi:hypothetical protein